MHQRIHGHQGMSRDYLLEGDRHDICSLWNSATTMLPRCWWFQPTLYLWTMHLYIYVWINVVHRNYRINAISLSAFIRGELLLCARFKNVPELRTLILEGFSCTAQVWNHWGTRQPGPCLCNQRFWSIHLQSVFPGKWDQRHTHWWHSILVSEQITKRAIVQTLNFVVPWTTNLV